jgi:hypothetical protein
MGTRLALLAVLLASCSSASSTCVPGASSDCACTDGSRGAQVCGSDHTFGACVCARRDAGVTEAGADDASADDDAFVDDAFTPGDDANCFGNNDTCADYASLHGDAIERDRDSYRASIEHWCVHGNGTATTTLVSDCAYDQTCVGGTSPSCQSCGAAGHQSDLSTSNGMLVNDCQGCRCDSWTVLECQTAANSQYHQSTIVLRRYGNVPFAVDLYVGANGTYFGYDPVGAPAGQAGIHTLTITGSGTVAPNGPVDMTVAIDMTYIDSLGVSTELVSHARVIGVCSGL